MVTEAQVRSAASAVWRPEGVDLWFDAPNRLLHNATPALSEDVHAWARGESLADDVPPTFAAGPAPESVFDCEEGDFPETPGWPEPFHHTATLANALGVPSDRSVYFALALVAAEMARLLDVYADGADSMEHKQEAADALDAFRSLRSAALAELIAKPGAST